jgi:hypothetical protein
MTLKTLLLSLVKWPIYWYLVWNGDTKGGKLLQDHTGHVNPFGGYSSNSNSPYKLPYKKGESVQCAQGHNGVWSHNFPSHEVYAVDYALDHDSEVLASRAGTVTDFSDNVTDHSTDWHNYINIEHDDIEEGMLPNPVHDRDHTGVVTTTGEYLHGRHFGVRHAFALLGIPQDKIVGTKIKQGQLIMFSGDTGMSAYNHLHVQIGTPNCNSVPFVYREVRNLVGKDGVPKALNNYVSDNEKTGEIPPTALYQPQYHGSTRGPDSRGRYRNYKTRTSGPNHVILDERASDDDDEYTNRFIYIWFVNVAGIEIDHEYKKITAYEGKTRKATVEGNWKTPPSLDSNFTIGAPPYDAASDFNKKFGYHSPFEMVGNVSHALNFPDGREPYKYATVAGYQPPALSGAVQTGSGPGGNTVILEIAASMVNDAYKDRFIIIKRNTAIIQYKKINAYEGLTKKVTIDGTWDVSILATPGGDDYVIGAPPFASATDEDKRYAYLCPDTTPQTYSPTDFAGGKKPYTYATFGI